MFGVSPGSLADLRFQSVGLTPERATRIRI
jgi:hypothetical protein